MPTFRFIQARLPDPAHSRAQITERLPEGFTAAPAYTSDLSDMIDRHKPQQWLFGHTHVQMDIQHGYTAVRNVSLGYHEHVAEGTEAAFFEKGLV